MPLTPRLPAARACCRAGLVALATFAAPAGVSAAPQEAARAHVTVVQAVDAAPDGAGGTKVTVHAEGPLPAPRVGILDAPARIYLDFAGVRLPSRAAAEWRDSPLRGIRLAQRSIDPLVARVVIDLQEPAAHRVDATKRGLGQVVVFVGGVAPGPAPTAPHPSAAAGYLERVSDALGRLHALRPAVASIDSSIAGGGVDLSAVADELEGIGRDLGTMGVPPSLATTHDLLLRACALGARAARMRHESLATGDADVARNAASAAAGALIVLDRATRDLGYVPAPPSVR